MTGRDASRREQAQAVFFSLIMIVSVMAIGGAAFAGSATANIQDTGDEEAVVVEDITVGESSTTQTVELQNINDTGAGDTLNLTHSNIGGSGEYNFTGVSLESSGDLNVTNVEVAGDADVGITIGTDTEAVEDNITLSLTVDTTSVSSSTAIDDTQYSLDDTAGGLPTVTGPFTLLDTDESVQLFDTDDNLIYTSGNIQPAIDEASADQRIEVASGTYDNGPVTIADAEGLTLEGPNADTNGDGDRGDEALIGGPVIIEQNNVTVTGFNITDNNLGQSTDDYAGGGFSAVQVGTEDSGVSDPQNVTLSNNTIYPESTANSEPFTIGVGFEGTDNLTIKGNLFTGQYVDYTTTSDIQDLEYSNNRFETIVAPTLGFSSGGDMTATVSENVFNGSRVDVLGNVEANITDNEFNGPANAQSTDSAVRITSDFASGDTLNINNNNFVDYATGVDNEGASVDATSNWWGSTDGPSGDFSGHGASVSGSVTVDPATVDTGSADLDAEFIGIVKDDASALTVSANSSAGFNIETLDEPANGTLVVNISGQEYVFEDALNNGEVVETDSSENASTDIANSSTPGFTNISVAGYDGATAIEQAGEVNLVHEARNAPNTGYFLTSMPQSGGLSYQGINEVAYWDGTNDEYQTFDDNDEVASVHHGLFMNATSADARYGFTYGTDQSEIRDQVGSRELDEGWHILGSNYNISDSSSINLDNDLNTQSLPSDQELVVYDSSVTTIFTNDDESISEYQAYYVFVHQSDTRPITLPAYNATARGNQGS